jgi:hypothetical protein
LRGANRYTQSTLRMCGRDNAAVGWMKTVRLSDSAGKEGHRTDERRRERSTGGKSRA